MTHVKADADGVTRRFPLVANNAGAVMAALPLALRLRRPVVLALSGLTVLVSWGVLAWLAWARADIWLPIAAPALGVALALPVLLVEGWWREGAERRRLHAIFGHYVAPEILRVLLEHPDAARLGGDRRRITVLFSDIRGYTTLSENLSPEAVVGWRNEYFNAQVGVIHAHRGTVDKFIGDAVMAFWGAREGEDWHRTGSGRSDPVPCAGFLGYTHGEAGKGRVRAGVTTCPGNSSMRFRKVTSTRSSA